MYDQSAQPLMDGIVLFSGPGGSSHGLRLAGVATTGIELDQDACDTAVKMGLQSIQGDVTAHDPRIFYDRYVAAEVTRRLLLQGSPPCPGFSKAGKGAGRADLPLLTAALEDLATTPWEKAEEAALEWRKLLEAECADKRSALTFEPIRWMAALHPDYIMLEQVPEVLVVWEEYAKVLRAWGYSVWCGKVYAEQYGVPQTRIRAFLLASRHGEVTAPVPTHSRYHNRTPKKLDEGVEKWVSMAEALGWGTPRRPYFTVAAGTAAGGADPAMLGGSGARKALNEAAHEDDWVPWTDTDKVGFPRKYDGGSGGPLEIDGVEYRARDFRDADAPAFAVTEKIRSWVRYPEGFDAPPEAQIAAGRTGGGTPRPLDRPSPTVTGGGTGMWIDNDETYKGPDGVTHMGDVITSRGTIRPLDEPAPTLTGSLDNGNTRWFDASNPPASLGDRELPWGGQINHAPGSLEARVAALRDQIDREEVAHEVTEGTADGLPRVRNQSGKPFDPTWPADRPATAVGGRGLIAAPGANTSAEKEARIDRRAVAEEVEHGVVEGQPRLNNQSGTEFDYTWPADRPAPVIAGRGLVTMPGANANRFNGSTKSRNDGIRVTVQEAGVLQSFPEDWSFQGSKTSQYQQVGNAVPPVLQYVLTTQLIGD